MKRISLAFAAAIAMVGTGAAADDINTKLNELVSQKLHKAFDDPVIVMAVKAQNEHNTSLSQAEIDTMDKQWRTEAKQGNGPLIDKVLANEVSKVLHAFKEQGAGLYSEVFVMDNKGLNVGQSDVTSDYWQGDEAKWQKTFGAGSGTAFIDDVEFDESSQTYQSQVSITLLDPQTRVAIGAVTVGVNVDALQ